MSESAPRTPFVAGNWKMFKTRDDAERFCEVLAGHLEELDDAVDLGICAPFTVLRTVADALVPHGVAVLAQNAHQAPEGAYTGEISMAMVADTGATGVLLGHSERRQLFGETDDALAEKVPAALAAGLSVMLCVGETEAEREQSATEARLTAQVEDDLRGVDAERLDDVTVAYEPVWAIGTGKTATPDLAQAAHAHIRGLLVGRYGAAGEAVRILYGGSVKPGNAAALFAQADIDGGLIGGASLDAHSLLEIARAAVP